MDYMSHTISNFGVLGVSDTSARCESLEVVLELHVIALDRDAARTVAYIANALTEVSFAEAHDGDRIRVVATVAPFKSKHEFAERVGEVLDHIAEALDTRLRAMRVHPSAATPYTVSDASLVDEEFADDPRTLHRPYAKTYPARRG